MFLTWNLKSCLCVLRSRQKLHQFCFDFSIRVGLKVLDLHLGMDPTTRRQTTMRSSSYPVPMAKMSAPEI